MARSLIAVKNVHAGYGSVRVLHGVDVEVRDGETVALLGTNGNGKSTLIRCIMGMVRPEAGEITLELDGQRIDLTRRSTEEIVDLGIALVPEGRHLFPKLTVEENLLLGAYRRGSRGDIARNLAPAAELGMTTAWMRNDLDWAKSDKDSAFIHYIVDDLAGFLAAAAELQSGDPKETR